MDHQEISKRLKSIGMKSFVNFFEICSVNIAANKRNIEIVDVIRKQHGDSYSPNSYKTRVSKIRSIIKANVEKEALEIITKSNAQPLVKNKAAQLLDKYFSAQEVERMNLEIQEEIYSEEYGVLYGVEGKAETQTIKTYKRDPKLATQSKARDKHTCRTCNFHFKNTIVHAHHLDPIAEESGERETFLTDLITLCPTCHALAHYLLRGEHGEQYKNETILENKIKAMHHETHSNRH